MIYLCLEQQPRVAERRLRFGDGGKAVGFGDGGKAVGFGDGGKAVGSRQAIPCAWLKINSSF